MTNKHTPGPWHIDASKSFYVFASGALAEQAGVEHGPFICNASTQANAALIASAPDLLAERDRLRQVNAELVAALERLSADCDGEFIGTAKAPRWAVLCASHATLTAAKGE